MGAFASFTKRILKKAEEKADKACELASSEIGEMIQEDFVRSVNDFYNSYSPTSYRRTEATFEASTGTHGETHHRVGHMHFRCGIKLDTGLMGEPYNVGNHGWAKHGIATASFIFGRTWDEGIHGFTLGEYKQKNKENGWNLEIFTKSGKPYESPIRMWNERRKRGKPLPAKMNKRSRTGQWRSTSPSSLMDARTKNTWGAVEGIVDKYLDL